ncbi:hypothetical protein BKA56DRAFT_620301 [Ilyonectria sp. MPI-CAGE-AT-0026]|nr:hypothetical protein BKA56DRAFT_620301 [Ilyonectria sp. MPI-CAGE-AT-0026]
MSRHFALSCCRATLGGRVGLTWPERLASLVVPTPRRTDCKAYSIIYQAKGIGGLTPRTDMSLTTAHLSALAELIRMKPPPRLPSHVWVFRECNRVSKYGQVILELAFFTEPSHDSLPLLTALPHANHHFNHYTNHPSHLTVVHLHIPLDQSTFAAPSPDDYSVDWLPIATLIAALVAVLGTTLIGSLRTRTYLGLKHLIVIGMRSCGGFLDQAEGSKNAKMFIGLEIFKKF